MFWHFDERKGRGEAGTGLFLDDLASKDYAYFRVTAAAAPNKRLQRTGISVPLIDSLPLAQLSPGRLSAALCRLGERRTTWAQRNKAATEIYFGY